MLNQTDHTDIHDLNLSGRPAVPRVLEMYQAGHGDLLRIRAAEKSIIVDSGPAECAGKLHRLLNSHPCQLLILTHLDADHFGGLHALVSEHLNGRLLKPVDWPEFIWVNDFEPRDAVSAVLSCVGGAPETTAETKIVLSKLVDAAGAWRESLDTEVHSMAGVDAPLDTELVIEADPATFRYLRMTAPVPWFRYLQTESKFLEALLKIGQDVERLTPDIVRKLGPVVDDLEKAHANAAAEIRAVGVTQLAFGQAIAYDDGAILVRSSDRFRIYCRNEELRDLITAGEIPLQITPDVRGLLHLARNGPRLLRSVAESSEVLTLVEALRRLKGVTVTSAKARDDTSLFSSIADLDILGPDDAELHGLARVWDRVRRKGQIHIDRRNDAFMEATLVRAMVSRYSPDSSPTNRSSIQIRAIGPNGSVVLTGDGRQETLMRGLEWSEGACRVFKAAHHGSARNIRTLEMPNSMLSTLRPDQIWVSGAGDKHPSRDFLDYLCRQYTHTPFRLRVTNTNAHLDALPRDAIPVETLTNDPLSIEF